MHEVSVSAAPGYSVGAQRRGDTALLAAAERCLGPGGDRTVRGARFDQQRQADLPVVRETVPPNAIVVVDGVFLYRAELNDLWDFRIFVATAPATSPANSFICKLPGHTLLPMSSSTTGV